MTALELWLIRHGESTANVAAAAAELTDSEVITASVRDADVPLSKLGREQAAGFGRWLARQTATPDAVWASSYLRAQETVSIALATAHMHHVVQIDERLRDREPGILDLLTGRGVRIRHPDEFARSEWLGKFHYRPPGGESWVDVIARVRDVLRDIDSSGAARVLVASHDAVVMQFIYVCLGLTEQQLLDFASANSVANASVTILRRASGTEPWVMAAFSDVSHLSAGHNGSPAH